MIRTMMLIPMVALLLACGLISSNDDPTEEPERTVEVHGEVRAVHYGDALIEEKILDRTPIVKARMTSFSSEVVVDAEGKFQPVLKFNLEVSEYLKGSGPSSIVAVWLDGWTYDTREDAEVREAYNLARRDDQWDDREAIIFMFDGASGLGPQLDEQIQLADHFYFTLGHRYFDDDRYSLHSDRRKIWLPAATSTRSTDDGQEFLLDVPSASGTAPTITLGELKTRIAEIVAELDRGDGSEAYETCVREKYEFEREIRYFRDSEGIDILAEDRKPQDSAIASGQPANTQLHQRLNAGFYPDQKAKTWLEGRNSDLLVVTQGAPTAVDYNSDGSFTAGSDGIEFTETFATARPLPDGEYEIDRKEVWPRYILCNFVLSHEWTITVTAPEGVLHEAFFDPVTDGTAVAADGANGILKPQTFTGDASATIERIAWDSGTSTLEVTPHGSVAGHAVDFIELDGTVSLSLNVDEATVDAASDTLTWAVPSQPWDDGDKLMVRIRESRNDCTNGTAVPDPVEHPGLVSDCMALLSFKNALRGTASLNWGVDLSIADWDGVTVEGMPRRVTRLRLPEKDLDGVVPSELGSLTTLTDLRLYGNQLSGEIPSELGGLTALEVLHLDDNRLTGEIPVELGSLTNLRELFLGRNQLEGEIPVELGGLTSLKHLNLDRNALTGAIPAQLESLANLQYLTMSGNQLTGSIPAELGSLGNLKDLFLNANQLTGSIPPELGRLPKLELLDLKRNRLTGDIPSELGDLTKLQWLYLRGNQLSGVIPSELTNLSNLESLWLSGNSFTGCIPSDLESIADNDLDRIGIQYCAVQ